MVEWYDPEIYGTIADWVSGIGTLIAIIVSLYFSLKDNFKQTIITPYTSYYFYIDGTISQSFLTIEVANSGKIPINVNKIGITRFKFNRRLPRFLQFWNGFKLLSIIKFQETGEQLPHMLQPQELKSFIPQGTLDAIKQEFPTANKSWIYVKDSTGRYYFSKKRIKI